MQQQPPVQKVSPQPVQQVQIPPVYQIQTPPRQQVEPPPIQQLQPPIESASAFAAAVEPAPAPAPVEPALSAAIPHQMPKPVLSFSMISETSILPVQPSSSQQQQPAISIPTAPTYAATPDRTNIPASEMSSLVLTSAPQSATQQPPPLTPQRITYTAAFDLVFISAAIHTFIPQAVSWDRSAIR